ncbi:hypothetical protein DFH27DRAFT_529277 [Peziza echinospora]|nr:hypothetical protein DFH27DRAFT_529277 [Peziza echinospora]
MPRNYPLSFLRWFLSLTRLFYIARVSIITAPKNHWGFGEGASGKYRAWRGAVKAQEAMNAGRAVTNWSHPVFKALVTYAVAHANLAIPGRTLYNTENMECPDGAAKHMMVNKAMRELVVDCLKKMKETARARQLANEYDDNDDDQNVGVIPKKTRRTAAVANGTAPARSWSVEFYIRDPNGYLHPVGLELPLVVPLLSSPLAPPKKLWMNLYGPGWKGRGASQLSFWWNYIGRIVWIPPPPRKNKKVMDLPENNPKMWIHCRMALRTCPVRRAYLATVATAGGTHEDRVAEALVAANTSKAANLLP